MTFAIFVTWVLVGVSAGLVAGLILKPGGHGLKRDVMLGLAGSVGLSVLLRTVGLFSGAGIATAGAIALVGAGLAIGAQRRFWPTESTGDEATGIKVWRWGLGAAVVAVVLWMTLGPAPQPAATAAAVEDKAYPVTPAAMNINAGLLTGDVTDMKITERIEQGSGRVVSTARLTAKVTLKNGSPDQTIQFVSGKIRYIDGKGAPIELGPGQTEPTLKFASGGNDRLDPGQEASESVDVDFPAEALKAATLKEIRLDLAYIPSPYRQETAHVRVSISGR